MVSWNIELFTYHILLLKYYKSLICCLSSQEWVSNDQFDACMIFKRVHMLDFWQQQDCCNRNIHITFSEALSESTPYEVPFRCHPLRAKDILPPMFLHSEFVWVSRLLRMIHKSYIYRPYGLNWFSACCVTIWSTNQEFAGFCSKTVRKSGSDSSVRLFNASNISCSSGIRVLEEIICMIYTHWTGGSILSNVSFVQWHLLIARFKNKRNTIVLLMEVLVRSSMSN